MTTGELLLLNLKLNRYVAGLLKYVYVLIKITNDFSGIWFSIKPEVININYKLAKEIHVT